MSKINIGDNLKQAKGTSAISNLRGVVDFGNLQQFDLFETGYGIFGVINGPYCLSANVQGEGSGYSILQEAYIMILEQEFRGLSGLDDMESDSSEITDGISTINLITKVTEQSAASVTITLLREKAGRTISKYHEAFLRCVKDPRSQFKTYLGAIKSNNVDIIDPGFDKEVFNFLYTITDNTGFRVEGAYILLCSQPTNANLSMLETEKGNHEFVDVSLAYNAFPIRSKSVNVIATNYVRALNITRDSTNYNWGISTGVTDMERDAVTYYKVGAPKVENGAIVEGAVAHGHITDPSTTPDNIMIKGVRHNVPTVIYTGNDVYDGNQNKNSNQSDKLNKGTSSFDIKKS